MTARTRDAAKYLGGRVFFLHERTERSHGRYAVDHAVRLGMVWGVIRVRFATTRGSIDTLPDGKLRLTLEQRYDLESTGGRGAYKGNWPQEIEDTALMLDLWMTATFADKGNG